MLQKWLRPSALVKKSNSNESFPKYGSRIRQSGTEAHVDGQQQNNKRSILERKRSARAADASVPYKIQLVSIKLLALAVQ